MSYETEITKSSLTINVVVKIGAEYFSRFQIDSGLIIPTNHLVVSAVTFGAVSLDLRDIKTTIPTNSIELLDKDNVVTTYLYASGNKYLNTEIEIYTGFITGSFPWSDYKLSSRSIIKTIDRNNNSYKLSTREIISLIDGNLYIRQDDLNGDITDSQTTIQLVSSALFPSSGYIKIKNEVIQYTANDILTNELSGLTRGDLFSAPDKHKDGDTVFGVKKLEGNPLTLILQLLISPGGGGTYDVLDFGLGISQTLIDVTGIEALRLSTFPSDVYRFYIYNEPSALSFIEKELVLATNTRLINTAGKISLAYIDQTTPIRVLDENTIIGIPDWNITVDKVVNRIGIKYSYSVGINTYARTHVVEDTDSINKYGLKLLTYQFKGIQADLNGLSIVKDRATKLIARLKDPRNKISTKTYFSNMDIDLGKTITLQHRYVPGISGMGIDAAMNVLSKGIDFKSGITTMDLYYTTISAVGITRSGVIAPSPFIVSVANQRTFDVPEGGWFNQGYIISIDGELQEIQSVTGNTIVTINPFVVILDNTKRVKFPHYDLVSEGQKNRYAFIGFNNNVNFADGKSTYKIVP